LADRLDGLDELAELCAGQRLVVMVGYCLRFHPAVAALKQAVRAGRVGRVLSLRAEVGQYLPDWRPGQDHRTGVSALAELGGGAGEWKVAEQRVRLFTPAAGWQTLWEGPFDPDAMYLAELRHFLDCVRTGERPLIDLGEGRRVLEIALAAKQAAALNRGVAV